MVVSAAAFQGRTVVADAVLQPWLRQHITLLARAPPPHTWSGSYNIWYILVRQFACVKCGCLAANNCRCATVHNLRRTATRRRPWRLALRKQGQSRRGDKKYFIPPPPPEIRFRIPPVSSVFDPLGSCHATPLKKPIEGWGRGGVRKSQKPQEKPKAAVFKMSERRRPRLPRCWGSPEARRLRRSASSQRTMTTKTTKTTRTRTTPRSPHMTRSWRAAARVSADFLAA